MRASSRNSPPSLWGPTSLILAAQMSGYHRFPPADEGSSPALLPVFTNFMPHGRRSILEDNVSVRPSPTQRYSTPSDSSDREIGRSFLQLCAFSLSRLLAQQPSLHIPWPFISSHLPFSEIHTLLLSPCLSRPRHHLLHPHRSLPSAVFHSRHATEGHQLL